MPYDHDRGENAEFCLQEYANESKVLSVKKSNLFRRIPSISYFNPCEAEVDAFWSRQESVWEYANEFKVFSLIKSFPLNSVSLFPTHA